MGKLYLAYGSNLNLKDMKERCKNSILVGKTELEGFRLVYKGIKDGEAYLTIEPSKRNFVPLGLFNIGIEDEKVLDHYEGYPELYRKKYLPVNFNGEEIFGMIYIMNREFAYHLPSNKYIETCLQGYCDLGFSPKILRKAMQYTKRNL